MPAKPIPKFDNEDGYMGADLSWITDPIDRLRVMLAQWHTDEVTGEKEAFDYADRLIVRMAAAGIQPVMENPEIRATVEGGVLQEITGRPEGWKYTVVDLDMDGGGKFVCPACASTVTLTAHEAAEVGTPHCAGAECEEQEMEPWDDDD